MIRPPTTHSAPSWHAFAHNCINSIKLASGDDRRVLRLLVPGHAGPDIGHVTGKRHAQRFGDLFRDDQTRSGDACLSRIGENAARYRRCGKVQVRIGEHNLRALSPQLERHRLDAGPRDVLHDGGAGHWSSQ